MFLENCFLFSVKNSFFSCFTCFRMIVLKNNYNKYIVRLKIKCYI